MKEFFISKYKYIHFLINPICQIKLHNLGQPLMFKYCYSEFVSIRLHLESCLSLLEHHIFQLRRNQNISWKHFLLQFFISENCDP